MQGGGEGKNKPAEMYVAMHAMHAKLRKPQCCLRPQLTPSTPVHVLQAALRIIGGRDAQVLGHLSIPDLRHLQLKN